MASGPLSLGAAITLDPDVYTIKAMGNLSLGAASVTSPLSVVEEK